MLTFLDNIYENNNTSKSLLTTNKFEICKNILVVNYING